MPGSHTITDDLTCAECAYNLRALPSDSNCPECGRAISESIRRQPLAKWLPLFRRGVTFLCIVMLAQTPWLHRWLYDQVWGHYRINDEGATFLVFAVLILPAACFMTAPAPSLPRTSRERNWLIGLTIAQLIFSVCALKFFRHPWPFTWRLGNTILLTAYALMPMVQVAQFWLLFELRYGSFRYLETPIYRPLYRAVQWCFLYSLLGPAIFFGLICFVRIKRDNPPVGSRYWINESLSRFLESFLVTPPVYIGLYAWFAALVIVLYCRFQMRRSAILN